MGPPPKSSSKTTDSHLRNGPRSSQRCPSAKSRCCSSMISHSRNREPSRDSWPLSTDSPAPTSRRPPTVRWSPVSSETSFRSCRSWKRIPKSRPKNPPQYGGRPSCPACRSWKLTYTDLALMHSLLIAERDCPENIKTLPTLCALRDRVKDTDGVKQYLASRPQLPF